ncbi:LamB/YcsF family protein [Marinicrinis lubricantis]|uniref:5-oxoprolinase subunit A n=1 Tax=Marinicrinis lubricantis TaxID=2086470 RepID=A0ABW1ILJ9_9BACL
MKIDINCDMGESFGVYRLGEDEQIVQWISSANIACGFHAGDPSVMRAAVELCLRHDVAVGAHPGLPDRMGFGRREIKVSPEEVYDLMVYQIGALTGFVRAMGGRLHHVKPHGALYNMAARDRGLADAIVCSVIDCDDSLILYGLAGSELIRASEERGLSYAEEVFADRTYQKDGSLTPRSHPQAVIVSEVDAIKQSLHMASEGAVQALTGERILLRADTICVHGDGEHALSFAKKLHQALVQADIEVKAVGGDSDKE